MKIIRLKSLSFLILSIILIVITVGFFYKNSDSDKERLMKYTELSFIDPIFSIPEQNKDIANLEKSIGYFEKITKEYPENKKNYPMDFLKSYSNLLRAQSDFFNHPDKNRAKKYQDSLERTVKNYQMNIDDISTSFKSKTKDFNQNLKLFELNGNYINPLQMSQDLGLFKENSKKLSEIIEERGKCLESSVSYCKRSEQVRLRYKGEVQFGGSGSPWLGIETGCFGKRPEIIQLKKECSDDIPLCINRGELDKDYYSITNSGSVIGKKLYEKGAMVYKKNVLTPYMCNDFSYLGILSNLEKFIHELKERRPGSGSKEIADIEKKIETSGGSDMEDIKELIDFYENQIFGLKNRDKALLSRYRILKSQLMNFPFILDNVVFYYINNTLENADEIEKGTFNSKNSKYTFMMRMNYSVMYLAYSPFVWKTDKQPVYFQNMDESLIPKNYLTKEEAFEKYGKNNVEGWTKLYQDLKFESHKKLYQKFSFFK